MSKRATQLQHYMHRIGSYSTRGSKGGLNLLGWDDLPEGMTPEQERQAMIARVKQITEMLSGTELRGNERRELGAYQYQLCKLIQKIRPKIKFRGLDSFFCDVVREELGDAKYRLFMLHAKHRWAKWVQKQEEQSVNVPLDTSLKRDDAVSEQKPDSRPGSLGTPSRSAV